MVAQSVPPGEIVGEGLCSSDAAVDFAPASLATPFRAHDPGRQRSTKTFDNPKIYYRSSGSRLCPYGR